MSSDDHEIELFPSPGNSCGSTSSTMPFPASLVAARDVFGPLLDKGLPNTSKRAPRGIYGASFLVGFDVRRSPDSDFQIIGFSF